MIPWILQHKKYGSKPWAVQREALNRSEGKTHYGYFLEQGLGKTGLTLNDFMYYYKQDKVDIMLVVCPNNFKLDWITAIEEWGLEWELRGAVWPKSVPKAKHGFVYAINWEASRTETGLKFIANLFKQYKVFLVFDESSYIKNHKVQVTKKAMMIARSATMVRELNGTPQTKDVWEWYPQLKVLNECNGMNAYAFRGRYGIMGGYMNYKIVATQNDAELAQIIDRCSFRALKKDWRKDLPPRIIQLKSLEMTPKQLKHYREMQKEFCTVVKGEKITARLVLTQIGKLRQISSCLVMNEEEHIFFEQPKDNPKVKATFELFNNQEGKVIIVYFYKATGKMLEQFFECQNISFAYIRGHMKPDELKVQKDYFNNVSECRVMIGQENTMSMGHTLIGQAGKDRCSTMIFFENGFSLRDRLQMLDRNHRGEQDETCHVYDLVTNSTEKKIIQGLNNNKQAADMIDELVLSLTDNNYNPYMDLAA